jgi:uncharacterized protein (TIGR02117 family)
MKLNRYYIKAFFLSIRNILTGLALLLFIYLVSAIFLSIIPVNSGFKEPKKETYYIYLASNGVHIDIILPAKDSLFNWIQALPFDQDIYPFIKYVGFGWGNKDFYINAPNWSDINTRITMNALFLKGEPALHVSPYQTITENKNIIRVNISKHEYIKVNQFIHDSFKKTNSGSFIQIKGLNYSKHDIFFLANQKYHLFNTCNTWTNKGLKSSGLKACLWTPFDRGVLYQYRKFKKKY